MPIDVHGARCRQIGEVVRRRLSIGGMGFPARHCKRLVGCGISAERWNAGSRLQPMRGFGGELPVKGCSRGVALPGVLTRQDVRAADLDQRASVCGAPYGARASVALIEGYGSLNSCNGEALAASGVSFVPCEKRDAQTWLWRCPTQILPWTLKPAPGQNRRLAMEPVVGWVVPQEGFEPPTPSLRMTCSTD